MQIIPLDSLDLLDVGNSIQLYGAIYSGLDRIYLVPLPDEDSQELSKLYSVSGSVILQMDTGDWEKFLKQSDVLDTHGPAKAILRKSQRQIDQNISWAVYRRDGYSCRYCGRANVPLTVDHVILWEENGATTEDNLVSACRRCNKLRGNTEYNQWIYSRSYRSVSEHLGAGHMQANLDLVAKLPKLRALSVVKQRTR